MANITLEDLVGYDVAGADLFNDSESFMRDLSDDELDVQGGITPIVGLATACVIYGVTGAAVGAVAGYHISRGVAGLINWLNS
jgi:hypothetical protein